MINETRSISAICADLKAKGEYEAAECIKRLSEISTERGKDSVDLLGVLEAILDTGLPRNREKAEKVIAKVCGETK